MRDPVGQPIRLTQLSSSGRRRAILSTAIRCVISVAVIGGLYFVLPLHGYSGSAAAVTKLVLGVGLFGLVMYSQVRRIAHSHLPELDAVQTVVIAVAVFLCTYASCYFTLSRLHPSSFSEHLDRVGSLYYTVTTFGTVGYGDIAAKSQLARLLVSSQILLDLVFIALILRLVFGVSRRALSAGD
jgi:voltage-gated potassium channel